MKRMDEAIPVLYYHSVGDHPQPRPKSGLSIPRAVFEEQMHRLLKRGFETVHLQDVHDYVAGQRTPTGHEVVLTFDDGFLDNWVYVYPLARKLGFKFTIYVNPDFVDPRDIVRPTLEDIWSGKVMEKDLEWWGFLSWAEMRAMEASGLVDIQSHTMTHTWHPNDPNVLDFHHPGDKYPWMVWNARPETKPFWLTEFDETNLPYGTPVHSFARAIPARRYIPDARVAKHLAEVVESNGGRSYFERLRWREELMRKKQTFQEKYSDEGRHETDDENAARIHHEVVESKHRIERALNKEVRFVCWPGGGETPLAREMALKSGHQATTKGTKLNRPGADPTHTFRVSPWIGARMPLRLKQWLFEGQLDRGRGVTSASGLAVGVLSSLRRGLST